ncbi:nucleotidyl transferase AbiEii/AbiGii toxin family protein [Rhizobium leguminosarum]|uniref:nucleotidyl transferase AbiEii/AbiGii toxin family protein n=1 Tax=Rhizobium leguminosarum TaxID=384 RepID=UPI001C943031|nr:nucleotidyl transferase AbiEii/AbiGii toxin family protein [Rhizobium leguminosarum]MBY5518642.1 nucleotidyl transferase AbiEii/AbiGii toxin family protein [Rhizobium leguminosarum]
MEFRRPEHRTIAAALRLMETDFLLTNKCWFAGGTAIVMHLDEYRLSLDVDFLCANGDGYRVLRMAAVESGVGAFFGKPVAALRDIRTDQYGIRTVLTLDGQPIRFEIVREARIALEGTVDPRLSVPVLSLPDMFAEKLLANADRCQDRAVAYRDALDLGMLLTRYVEIPAVAVHGQDIERKIGWVLARLEDETELRHAASVLQMDGDLAVRAIAALRGAARRLWSS